MEDGQCPFMVGIIYEKDTISIDYFIDNERLLCHNTGKTIY